MDLKPVFDAARAADQEVQRVLNEMTTAFGLGTDEGRQAALDLRPGLQTARKAAEDANALYVEMRDAAQASGGMAKNFVPVPGADSTVAAAKSMSFAEFGALDASARMAFIKSGGQMTD